MQTVKIWLKSVLLPFGLVRNNLTSLMRFELIYRILTMFVFFPLITWIYRLLPFVNKTSVITTQNLKRVVLNPLSWIVMAVIIFLMTVCA